MIKSNQDPESLPIILLSGMGADSRVFVAQSAAFPELVIPAWIEPEGQESIQEYAARFAKQIDPGVPCVIGGASFGGVVAQEVAHHLDAKACLLIGSFRHPKERRRLIRCLQPVAGAMRWLPYGLVIVSAKLLSRTIGNWLPPFYRNLLSQAHQSNSQYFRWAVPALVRWTTSTKTPSFPIYQIHGDKDQVIPIKDIAKPDHIIKGGGHVISMRHGPEVNSWIRSVLSLV